MPAKPPKRQRACEACHAAKVRCELTLRKSISSSPCRRCRKAGRDCFPAAPRLQRNRIAELESQVQALTRALEVQRSKSLQEPPDVSRECHEIEPRLQGHPDFDEQASSTLPSSPLVQLAIGVGISIGVAGPTLPQPTSIAEALDRTAELKRQIETWTAKSPASASEPSLIFHRHIAVLYLNEVVLHTPTNTWTFGPPYTPERIAAADFAAPAVTIDHIAALYAVKDSSHAALDIALRRDLTSDPSITPETFHIRVVYAVFVLVKLYVAVTAPGNTYGTVLSNFELRLEEYFDRFRYLNQPVVDQDSTSHLSVDYVAIGLLEDWFVHYKAIAEEYERRMNFDFVWTPSGSSSPQRFGVQVQPSADHAIKPTDLVWLQGSPDNVQQHHEDTHTGKQGVLDYSQHSRMEWGVLGHI